MSQIHESKVVLLGAASVGKTCIVTREISDFYDPEQTPTVGASFSVKTITIGDITMNLRIWDTAGQERFRSLAPMYYQGSQAAIIVFSIIDSDSFEQAEYWINELKMHFTTPPALFLVGNKVDLADSRIISAEQAERKAKEINATYFETSAKNGQNVSELFECIADTLINHQEITETTDLELTSSSKTKQKCC